MQKISICPYCKGLLRPIVIDMSIVNHKGGSMSKIDWDEHKRVWNAIQFNHTKRGLLVCDKCAFGVRAVTEELK